MLNQVLYDALAKLFNDDIVVVNEGQQAELRIDRNHIGRWDIEQHSDHGEQYAVNCPFCRNPQDTNHHLYISYLSFATPVVDGVRLQIGKLRAQCFRNGCLKDLDNRNTLSRKIGLTMSLMTPDGNAWADIDPTVHKEPEEQLQVSKNATLEGVRSWVPDYQPVTEDCTDVEVLQYLDSRRITLDDVEWLHIGYGPVLSPIKKRYLNNGTPWILFPVINNGVLVGVQARCLPQYLDERGIKYWTHPACRKRTVLYNLDAARDIGLAVVCEGVFDVASVGKPGVCLFGHTPSKIQMTMLSTFRQGVVWLPDNDLDCVKEAKVYADRLNLSGALPLGAHVVTLPAKDAGEMPRADVWKHILNQVPQAMAEYIVTSVVPQL